MTMKYFTDTGAARAAHETSGGWLLNLGDGVYQVTDDAGLVYDMREHGEDYLRACEILEHWDETKSCDIPDHVATLMDDDIREKLRSTLNGMSSRDILVAYLRAHRERFGEEFIVNEEDAR